MLHEVLLYCTYPIPEAKLLSIRARYSERPPYNCPQPDNITPSTPADETHEMSPAEIYTHYWSKIPETAGISGVPIVVLDEDTIVDDTAVLVISQGNGGEPLMLRFIPE